MDTDRSKIDLLICYSGFYLRTLIYLTFLTKYFDI